MTNSLWQNAQSEVKKLCNVTKKNFITLHKISGIFVQKFVQHFHLTIWLRCGIMNDSARAGLEWPGAGRA